MLSSPIPLVMETIISGGVISARLPGEEKKSPCRINGNRQLLNMRKVMFHVSKKQIFS